jgi:hypothetical protein
MKKIFSIVLALALVLGLSLATATSVVANVGSAIVTVDPNEVGKAANYTIAFNITSTLAIGGNISIGFPTGTTVPTTYATGVVTVQSTVENATISSGDISVVGQVVTITLPIGIGAPDEVTVVFNATAGIKNPATPKSDYTLNVRTSKEPTLVASQQYTIRLSNKSTYEFVYGVPQTIWVDQAAGVNVTLRTSVLGQEGYNQTQITFNVTDKPADSAVTFQVYYEGQWLPVTPFTNSGYWPPDGGNFSVSANYTNTVSFNLTFNKVGVYTVKFVLDDLEGPDLIVDEISFAVTGVSREVELNKGWNLISLPIVPDNKATAAVLAPIIGNVTSVHYYNAATAKWLIYSPPDFTTLTTIEDGKAYWINMKAAANLTVVGQAVAPPGYGPVPPTYSVVQGWNMVGFKALNATTVDNYLKGTNYVRIYGFDLGEGVGWFSLSKDDYMEPGLGYWVAFSEPGTIYP